MSNSFAAPAWFHDVLAAPYRDHHVDVAGAALCYRTWGDRDAPAIHLVHGGGAHLHWWDFIAPLLAEEYFILAHDVGGMGDSGYRDAYSPELFVEEVMAVQEDAGLRDRKPVLVGHSMGGAISLRTGATHGARLRAVIMVDSPIRPPEDAARARRRGSPFKPKRIYEHREAAVERFRLIPDQPCDNDFILRYIAEHSVRETDGGWTWKFDDKVFATRLFGRGQDALAKLSCPLGVIYGAHSQFFTAEVIAYMRGLLPPGTPFAAVPEAHHHLFLDQPIAFVAALRTLLSCWPRS
ncbi:MAG: alpha/beta hydrolase [Pseudomonadota bacterium]|nr:alpha/beta hydrolase [Pseudomonadota bacterium]